jgi:hypothetical protein
MTSLILNLIDQHSNDFEKVTAEWLFFDWNKNGFNFTSQELELLFQYQQSKAHLIQKLSSVQTSLAESYNSHNLVHFSKRVAVKPVTWKIKCLVAWMQWNQVTDWYTTFKHKVYERLRKHN